MAIIATIAAILNMAGAMADLRVWTRLVAILGNVGFVIVGAAVGEVLVWGTHLALIPLNAALLFGALGRSA